MCVPPREVSPLWKVLSKESVRVLVCAALPGAVRIGEVDRQTGIDLQLCMLREFLAAIPGERPTELIGKRGDPSSDGILHSLRPVSGECGAVVHVRLFAVALHSWQVQQDSEPRGALHQRADRRLVAPDDQVTLPVAGDGTVFGLGGSFGDHYFRCDMAVGLLPR